jgi:hypothetical protein
MRQINKLSGKQTQVHLTIPRSDIGTDERSASLSL